MSELPGGGSVHARGILQAGVGGRSRAREAREGALAGAARPMALAPGPAAGPEPVSTMGSVPEPLGLLATHEQQQQQQQLFRQYLDDCSLIPARLLRDIEERRRLFVEGCRAREAAFDADPPPMDSAAAAFTVALGASDD
ncbi:EP300-interacting inhibitor of differentiation 2B [Ochotona princeps]|uniref:EP300-interacting inhibitor of differentiation 2B n=1 Tax=Ochotona princeps TaxID=9978 RepID=UPI0027148409|nr:EP300-interacting inhibitor of differentiation 2B [Ochotona princeps]